MLQYICIRKDSVSRMQSNPALLLAWSLGLVVGVYFFLSAGTPVFSMMREIPAGSVSIVSLLVTGLIPFLFTAYAVFISSYWLILAVCFCKAILNSFISMGITVAYASAGWLVRSLLLISDSFICVLLLFLWLRFRSESKTRWFLSWLVCIVISTSVFYIISPYAAGLIEIKKG